MVPVGLASILRVRTRFTATRPHHRSRQSLPSNVPNREGGIGQLKQSEIKPWAEKLKKERDELLTARSSLLRR
jgi:hypothetical protein